MKAADCRRKSWTLKSCSRRLVCSITLGVADLFHFSDHKFQLVVGGVEVWRDPNARTRSVVDNELSTNEFLRDGRSMFVCDCNRAAALPHIFWTRDFESGFLREFDQVIRLAHALLANLVDADLVDDPVAGFRCVQGRNCRRAV